MIGTKLAHFTITAHLGSGGMGEVYQATDSKLGRNVAIKLLPEAFSHDNDRAARFEREARVLASLNHPHIAAIYGIEQSGERKFLVMELVSGETLAERIKRGPIPIDEALGIAKQIADALEAAHEKSIVHRDLKPANIKITPQGQVKVLDFGLAKAFEGEVADGNLSNSPTMMSMAGTNAGMILGTAAYMSPEQAKGQNVDRRTDIFAFGAVLYEMLTGKQAFAGQTVSDILSRVILADPDWSRLPNGTSTTVRHLLRRCLQKDRSLRLRDAGDARLEILEPRGEVEPAVPQAKGRERVAWIVAVVAVVGLAALAIEHFRETPPPEEQRLLQYSLPYPEDTTLGFLEISPDGRRLVMVAQRDGKNKMYVRSLDLPELQPLSGTDNARTPFWSPDSRFIGFFADGKLKVMPAAGGPAQVLCSETGLGGGGTWSRNGVILFGSDRGPLRRVDAAGGMCAAVGTDDPKLSNRFPVFLPDGSHFFYLGATQGDDSPRGVYLASMDNPTPRKILADYSSVVYAPPGSGGRAHLLFLRENSLMAQPFDNLKLETVGDPFPVAPRATGTFNTVQVAASVSNGTLVYMTKSPRLSQLTWFDRSGKELGQVGSRAEQTGGTPSPDGNDVLISRTESNGQIATWLYDLARGSESRFLPSEMQAGVPPVWFPDGRRVLVVMTGSAGLGLYQVGANDGGQAELVLPIAAGASIVLSTFSRDGRFLVYTSNDPRTQADIWYLPWADKPDWGKAVKFLATDVIEGQGQLSPDGKWIAYTSFETGTREIYIRAFPTGPGVWKVSVDGGTEPRWSPDGKQLYYLRPVTVERSILLAALVESDGPGALRTGTPQTLFEIHALRRLPGLNVFTYVPYPDGRFLVAVADEDATMINVITNWQKAVANKGQSEGR